MKTIISYHHILIVALAMVFNLAVTPAMATSKKSSSNDDQRVKDYKRKIADVNQRLETAAKARGRAASDYKEQTERKQKEMKFLI